MPSTATSGPTGCGTSASPPSRCSPGGSLLAGGGFGRLIAYIWAILVIVQSFLIIGQAPWYAALMILLAVLVIHGLSSTKRTSEA